MRRNQFMLVATIEDERVGENSFTAEELESTLRDALRTLHLKVEGISVVRHPSMPPIPGSRPVGAYQVKPPQTLGEANAQSAAEGEIPAVRPEERR